MQRYTTCTVTCKVKNIDLSDGFYFLVILAQGGTRLELESTDDAVRAYGTSYGSVVAAELTQDQTAQFTENREIEVQIQHVDEDGKAGQTNIGKLMVERSLANRSIEYPEEGE